MREASWAKPPALPLTLSEGPLHVRLSAPGPLTWLTGELGAAMARLAPDGMLAGYEPDIAHGAVGYRIAADRALLVGPAATVLPDGWHAAGDGFATGRCDGAWMMVEIDGPLAREAMTMLVAHPLDTPSPSAAMLVSGRTGLVRRTPGGWSILVEAPHTAFHASRLMSLVDHIAG